MTAISLLLLVGLFSIAGAIMAYYFLNNPDILFPNRAHKKPVSAPVHIQLEDGKFVIPGYLVRKLRRTALRKVYKINLILPINWYIGQPPITFTDKSNLSEWVLASIEKRSSFLSERNRLNNIFRHYIDTPAIAHAIGLYRYRFKSGSPYENTELFTDNLQTPSLIIRCDLQSVTGGTRLCSRQILLSSRLTMLYKFPHSRLNQWQQVHKTMQNLLASIFQRSGV